MEEPKAAPNPPTATANAAAPPQQPPPTVPEQPASKKRPLENSNNQYQNSPYFKMRLALKDLRPHFIEVLSVSDFRNCRAADEIKEKTKRLVELYKQMLASVEKSNNAPGAGGQTLQVETGMKQKPQEQAQVVKPAPAVLSKTKILQSSSVTGKLQADVGEAQGTYIVGGSAFGWNFITFTGNQPVYYGVTKESFRSAQASSGLEGE